MRSKALFFLFGLLILGLWTPPVANAVTYTYSYYCPLYGLTGSVSTCGSCPVSDSNCYYSCTACATATSAPIPTSAPTCAGDGGCQYPGCSVGYTQISGVCPLNYACCQATATNGDCNPTHYLCNVGASINNIDGATAWTWSCQGYNGGTTDPCSQIKPMPTPTPTSAPTCAGDGGCQYPGCSVGYTQISGVCPLNYACCQATATNGDCNPTHYLCNVGAPINPVDGANAWTWTCNGYNGGAPDSCVEIKPASTLSVTNTPPIKTSSTLNFTFTNFQANATVTIGIVGGSSRSVTANSSGGGSSSLTLGATAGTYTLQATDSYSHSATTSFTVVANTCTPGTRRYVCTDTTCNL